MRYDGIPLELVMLGCVNVVSIEYFVFFHLQHSEKEFTPRTEVLSVKTYLTPCS